jgi:hypothetical protein
LDNFQKFSVKPDGATGAAIEPGVTPDPDASDNLGDEQLGYGEEPGSGQQFGVSRVTHEGMYIPMSVSDGASELELGVTVTRYRNS